MKPYDIIKLSSNFLLVKSMHAHIVWYGSRGYGKLNSCIYAKAEIILSFPYQHLPSSYEII